MSYRRSSRVLTIALMVSLAGWGCSPAPSKKPVQGGSVNTGTGSVEYERRQLLGTWSLDRLEVTTSTGEAKRVNSKGTLTYDEYGNIKVSAQLLEPLPDTEVKDLQALVEYSGRITLDPVKHIFVLRAPDVANVDPGLAKTLDTEKIRQYEIVGDKLTIAIVTPQGRTTAKAAFTRAGK